MDDSVRPDSCEEVPDTVCAVLYDSGTCGGGWVLQVRPGAQRRLEYFSSDWKYRSVVTSFGSGMHIISDLKRIQDGFSISSVCIYPIPI